MRRALVIALGLSLVGLGQGLIAQQGRGGGGGGKPPKPEPTPARAEYSAWAPDPMGGDGIVPSAILGGYDGEIGELQFLLVGEASLTFICSEIEALDSAPPFPGCEDPEAEPNVTVTSTGLRHMPTLTLSPNEDCGTIANCDADGFAKQHNISWKVGKTEYSLQWVLSDGGQPPDYPRVECHATRGQVDDDRCIEATMDTRVGNYDSTVDTGIASLRQTGSQAWLRVGKGSNAVVGFYRVPFSMHVIPVEADSPAPAGSD